ncbi:MAG: hypothetical protein GY940_29290, partial [bacterium]|nr:hypothetical protein [bacterium]
GTEKGLNQLNISPDRISVVKQYPISLVRAVMEDKKGNLWVGTDKGLLVKEGKSQGFTMKLEGHIMTMCEDKAGSIWISIHGRGLAQYKNQRFIFYKDESERIGKPINSLYVDRKSVLWLSTNSGLCRFRDNRLDIYSKENGFISDLVFHVLEDEKENLWLGCHEGIFRVKKKDLDDYSDGKISFIPSVAYGEEDGMRSSECNDGFQGGCKTRNGNLWFATIKGAVMIVPGNIK